ncbi:MAG: efflux RND transporter periplasmic adaptor subunit [Pseudomonadales bacterium]
MMMRNVVIPAAVVVLSLIGAAALIATQADVRPAFQEPVPTVVRVLEVTPKQVKLSVHSQGTAVPKTQSELVPEVSGRVTWISPSLVAGGFFETGEVLLKIDERNYRTAVERSRANVSRAEAEYEHARFEHGRLVQLEKRQLTSRSAMEGALRTMRVAEASMSDASAALEQAEFDLERTQIQAPFTGLVSTERVDLGQFVSRGNAVATLYASGTVEVRLPIADHQLAYLNLALGHRGLIDISVAPPVTLTADYAGKIYTWEGHVVRTEGQIDAKSRMVNVVASVDNETAETPLTVGLFVEAEIEGRLAEDVVVLPRNALRNGNQVLVVDDDDRLRYRDVKPLRMYRDQVLIREGLEAGERVCISPLQTVIDGMPVEPIFEQISTI